MHLPNNIQYVNGPVAQLDRVPDFESVGRVFESRRGRQKQQPFRDLIP